MRHWIVLIRVSCVLLVAACGRLGFEQRADPTTDAAITDGADGGDAATVQYNRVFVSSTIAMPVGSMLGSIAGADTFCSNHAATAGLSGPYVAWLSDQTVNAPDRLSSARGWVRIDGKPFADTVADMLGGRIFHPVRLDENGTPVDFVVVLTGTLSNGMVATNSHCQSYSSDMTDTIRIGGADRTTQNWNDNNTESLCNNGGRIYCFGTEHNAPLVIAPESGPRAFVTASPWPVAGGLAGADGFCQAAADAESLGGAYRALLSTTSATAASRFTDLGLPWVRLDGIRIGTTRARILAGDIDAPINVDESGAYHPLETVWTGADRIDLSGTDASTCGNWASTVPTGRVGHANAIVQFFRTAQGTACSGTGRLYCLEI